MALTKVIGSGIGAVTSIKTPLIEFTDGDDAIAIADSGYVTQTGLPFVFVNGDIENTYLLIFSWPT